MSKYLSIEAGMSQLRIADIEQRGRKIRMHSCFTIPLPQGAVEDGYIRDTQMVGDLLKAELKERRIHPKRTVFVINSSRVASREIRIPYVKADKIQDILEANISDYFPVDPAKYVLSYTVLGVESTAEPTPQQSGEEEEEESAKKKKKNKNKNKKKNEPGERQYHLMAYASPTSISASYQEMAGYAGLKIKRLDFVGSTIFAALRHAHQQGTHIVMKIEEKGTLFTIIRDGELVLQRTLNYGIDQAAETVRLYPVFGKDLDFEASMHVLCSRKCIRGSLDPTEMIDEPEEQDDFVREAVREVTESVRYLVGNISRIMDYYSSRNNNAQYDSISCCGLGAQVIGLSGLLSHELGQQVDVVSELHHTSINEQKIEGGIALYAALAGVRVSEVNLSVKESAAERQKKDSISGAVLIFFTGAAGGMLLFAGGFAGRLYQVQLQEYLNKRISEESSVEQIYDAYNTVKAQHESLEAMYAYTNSPNEGLVAFIEEMEEKMPSSITVESFNSTGTQVSFSMRVSGKAEAANTLIQLRTFESLSSVVTSGISEQEDGTVSMSVVCTYAEPAKTDGTAE